jgi:hypothetical protein
MEFIMKDVVIGAITKYNWDQVKCWVNSLDQSGFDGTKILLCYDISYELAEELTKRNYTIFAFKKNDEEKRLEYPKENWNICLERFLHIWYFLSKLQNKEQYRYVIATDVGDVIFQSNPSEWLEKNIGNKQLNVGSECIQYKNEEWNRQNMYLSFGPIIAESMQDKLVYNAGAIAGKFDSFLDLCHNVFLACGGAPVNVPGGGAADQAALNVLLSMKHFSDITNFAKSQDGWAAQLEIMANPVKIEKLKDFITEPRLKIENGEVFTHDGKKYCIVHQYDVIPELSKYIREKYA